MRLRFLFFFGRNHVCSIKSTCCPIHADTIICDSPMLVTFPWVTEFWSSLLSLYMFYAPVALIDPIECRASRLWIEELSVR